MIICIALTQLYVPQYLPSWLHITQVGCMQLENNPHFCIHKNHHKQHHSILTLLLSHYSK
ncbi:hypothetical protein Hanom_Chr08g00749951 [Helianthus anomalus]